MLKWTHDRKSKLWSEQMGNQPEGWNPTLVLALKKKKKQTTSPQVRRRWREMPYMCLSHIFFYLPDPGGFAHFSLVFVGDGGGMGMFGYFPSSISNLRSNICSEKNSRATASLVRKAIFSFTSLCHKWPRQAGSRAHAPNHHTVLPLVLKETPLLDRNQVAKMKVNKNLSFLLFGASPENLLNPDYCIFSC